MPILWVYGHYKKILPALKGLKTNQLSEKYTDVQNDEI